MPSLKISHGGNRYKYAKKWNCEPTEIYDFSASLNPLGSPNWIDDDWNTFLNHTKFYPEPDAISLRNLVASTFNLNTAEIVAGNGCAELLYVLPRALNFTRAVIPVPTYSDYDSACIAANIKIKHLFTRSEQNFALNFDELAKELKKPALVFLGQPNNPTGNILDYEQLKKFILNHKESFFIIDESYKDFVPNFRSMIYDCPENAFVVYSLTKIFCIPGIRLGLGFGSKKNCKKIQSQLPSWNVNSISQQIGSRALNDKNCILETQNFVQIEKEKMKQSLTELGFDVFFGQANFLLCKITNGKTIADLQNFLEKYKIIIRDCSNILGLGAKWTRIAILGEQDNNFLLDKLKIYFTYKINTKKNRILPPALMIQGTTSNAGKSILAAAFCRIFTQDGYKTAPFKSQNMSLNSYVTAGGGEMGRAQVVQAMACGLKPNVDMNPILLKPNSDTGSQIIIKGKAIGSMDANIYFSQKKDFLPQVHQSYLRLSEKAEIMVIEGAGSPVEINLKSHDIVNMYMAKFAKAKVILTTDIDRGGSFAALIGTMNLLKSTEQDLILGYILNKFRGHKNLLTPALDFMLAKTKKPILGIIPYINNLDIPDEDSVSFKNEINKRPSKDKFDIAVIDLPHISNATDIEPLKKLADVNVRIVRTIQELYSPDLLILPGSKNVISDLKWLQNNGLAHAILSLDKTTKIFGICGGLQILGEEILDPHGIESKYKRETGLNLLNIKTEMLLQKTLCQTTATLGSLSITGYEIHHGETNLTNNHTKNWMLNEIGKPIGYQVDDRIFATYLHGVFDSCQFRDFFFKNIIHKISKIESNLETSLDNLADIVRKNVDMDKIYKTIFS